MAGTTSNTQGTLQNLDDLIGAALAGEDNLNSGPLDICSDTDRQDAIVDSPAAGKHCNVCGKNVAGQRRYKDKIGYWCVDCHRADARKTHRVARVRCVGCKKSLPENAAAGGAAPTCSRCQNEQRAELDRQSIRLAKIAKERKSKRNVQLQLTIAIAILAAMVFCYQMGWLTPPRHVDEANANDLMSGARAIGLTFLAMVGGFVWWIKRQV